MVVLHSSGDDIAEIFALHLAAATLSAELGKIFTAGLLTAPVGAGVDLGVGARWRSMATQGSAEPGTEEAGW